MELCFLIFLCCTIGAFCNTPHKRFEYKLSFKGPHLIQKDGNIPFWQHGGDAIASDDSIRVTPSLRSKRGWIWSKNTNPHSHWEVDVSFRVTGRGRIGADGLAIWYTEKEGSNGMVFGGKDQWNGLGIFFDSFDNDNQHNNPYVMVMLNDGTKLYDHNSDGSLQQLGGCMRDYRNKPYLIKARIHYIERVLTIWVHNGMANNAEDYEMCLRAENVDLPQNGYFGISAATGGLADDHDVTSFITHSLKPAAAQVQPDQAGKVTDEETKKYEKEYEEYWDKLQKSQEEYKKEHPDKIKDIDEDDWFENQQDREIKQIFQGQTKIGETLMQLQRKLDEIIGKQENTLSQISNNRGHGVQQVPQGQAGGQAQPIVASSIQRHEVDSIINSQRDISNTMIDLKNLVGEMQHSVNRIQSNSGQPGGQGQGQAMNSQIVLHEVKDTIHNLRGDVQQLIQRPPPPPLNCPPIPNMNCISPMYFFIFMALQLITILGYMIYKSSQEASAKKFY